MYQAHQVFKYCFVLLMYRDCWMIETHRASSGWHTTRCTTSVDALSRSTAWCMRNSEYQRGFRSGVTNRAFVMQIFDGVTSAGSKCETWRVGFLDSKFLVIFISSLRLKPSVGRWMTVASRWRLHGRLQIQSSAVIQGSWWWILSLDLWVIRQKSPTSSGWWFGSHTIL